MKEYQQRVVDELAELRIKTDKLEAFIGGPAFGEVHLDEQHRLHRQLVAMKEYARVLEERIEYFDEDDEDEPRPGD